LMGDAVNWFKSMFDRGASRRRIPQQSLLTRSERFEPRLCLGRMVAPAAPEAPVSYDGLGATTAEETTFRLYDAAGESDRRDYDIPHEPDPAAAAPSGHNAARGNAPRRETMLADGLALHFRPDLSSAMSEPGRAHGQRQSVHIANAGSATTSDATPEGQGGAMPGTATIGAPAHGASIPDTDTPPMGGSISNDTVGSRGAGGKIESGTVLDSQALASIGLKLDANGNAIGLADDATTTGTHDVWWKDVNEPVVVRYDFRDQGGFRNQITTEQQAVAVAALNAWSDATGGKVIFVQDTNAPASHIVNIGTGDLQAFGHVSGAGGLLGLGGGHVTLAPDGQIIAGGVAWLDAAENWDNTIGNGDQAGTFDFFTVVAHEQGHTLGFADSKGRANGDIMTGVYTAERSIDSIRYAAVHDKMNRTLQQGAPTTSFNMDPMVTDDAQLRASEVEQLLMRAAAVTSSEDGIFAVVDRNGRILGVRVEAQALAAIPDTATLVFAIDGAVAKARTAAFFSNGDAEAGAGTGPLTSRLVGFLSQSTITQREVESNPNADNGSAAAAAASTVRGPGFVAPVGLGAHFPPGIANTPPVDLFGIEHTNRDSNIAPGPDGVKGTADDVVLRTSAGGLEGRFNIDPAFVPADKGLFAPESYGASQNSNLLPNATGRGIATLPGGIPLYRDTNFDGVGDTLVGGIGVFFPGTDGYATHEQGFVAGIGQTYNDRVNAPRVLEAEFIAFVAAGGSAGAAGENIIGAKPGTINGVAPVPNLDLPFGRIDLVGITLAGLGPVAGRVGAEQLINFGARFTPGDPNSGADQLLIGGTPPGDTAHRDGQAAPDGWLVTAHASTVDPISAADVERLINEAIKGANAVRAAIRLPFGNRAKMVFAVTDTTGEILGLYRMPDATVFSIDVAVAKARNVAYYADAADLQPIDQVAQPGIAFTNRTFRFLAEPRFPDGIDRTQPPPFSILNDPGINPLTGENTGAPTPAGQFTSVLGHDAFNPMTNFRDPGDPTVVAAGGVSAPTANQNGIVFFPGSTPIYRNGQLIGGLGVSGDGVDQDDVVTFIAAQGFLPNQSGVLRADQIFIRDVRLPYIKFLRNPFG
jgi:uncharacterized protein GlcG (DUF336 family)